MAGYKCIGKKIIHVISFVLGDKTGFVQQRRQNVYEYNDNYYINSDGRKVQVLQKLGDVFIDVNPAVRCHRSTAKDIFGI